MRHERKCLKFESKSAIHFCNIEKGNLTHLHFLFGKAKLLGTEFKTVEVYFTGAIIFLDIMRGK